MVPGRKTDVKDARWIANLLACGLITPSFVPEQAQRDLRDLTRSRTTLLEERTRVSNRIQKVLEDTNIWTAICPRNEESAGKRKRSRVEPSNKWLKSALVEAAQAAAHTKDSYFRAQIARLPESP